MWSLATPFDSPVAASLQRASAGCHQHAAVAYVFDHRAARPLDRRPQVVVVGATARYDNEALFAARLIRRWSRRRQGWARQHRQQQERTNTNASQLP
jgi:hypothetical protein